jgi:hypothetical protein
VTLPGTLGIRKLHTDSQGRLFAVHGFTVTEIFQDHTVAERGSINTGAGPVSMDDNGQELIMVDGAYGYTFAYATSSLNDIVDGDFLGATHVGFLDGYFVLRPPTVGQTFYWSDLYAATFTATNVASAEGNPDVLVALLVAHREIWLFGRTTTELWYSTGQAGADAFARLEGALVAYGCLAPDSPAVVGDTICWLGQNTQGDRLVLQAVGATPHRISTHPLEAEIQGYTSVEDARGWGYQAEGHGQYVLTFPHARATTGMTWVYDTTTGLWHKWSYHQPLTGEDTAHLAQTHAFAFGRHYIGSLTRQTVYVLDRDTYTDAGVPIVRVVTLPPVFDAERLGRLSQSRLQIDAETGVGLPGGVVPGTDPLLELSYSDDGGHNFCGYRQVSLGRQGEYKKKVVFRRLGQSEDRRYRLRTSAPCKFVILGAVLE